MMYTLISCCLLYLASAVPVDSNNNNNNNNNNLCATYYIHEYHAHGNQSEAGIPPHMTSSHAGSSSPFKSDSARWTSVIEELEGELLIEKNKRIQQLTEFLKWMRVMSRVDVGDNNAMNRRVEKILTDIEGIVKAEKNNRKKKPVTVLEKPTLVREERPQSSEAFKLGVSVFTSLILSLSFLSPPLSITYVHKHSPSL